MRHAHGWSGSLALATALAGSLSAAQAPAPGDVALVPLVGLWRTGVDGGRTTITIDGTAPPKPDEAGATRVFGGGAAPFVAVMSAPGVFPLAAAPSLGVVDGGRLSVEFKLIAGATDQTAGVAFNIRPDGTYQYARYNTKDGNVAVWKFENGARTVLAHGEAHEGLAFGVWHRLSVTIAGRAVEAVVNDRLKVFHTLDRDVRGHVGLWTKADSVTAFRAYAHRPR
jgi:hypothetical protein